MTSIEQFEFPEEADKRLDESLIESHAARLAEHFDSVRIVCTKNRGTTSRRVTRGEGDWYAQVGVVRDWLTEQDEQTRVYVRNNND